MDKDRAGDYLKGTILKEEIRTMEREEAKSEVYRLLEFFAPEAVDEDNLSFDILSIFGIILYFNYSRPMVSRITGKSYDADFKARLIEQMVRFSSYGLSVKGRDRSSK